MSELRSSAPVFRTAADGRIRKWNPACEELTGIGATDAEGRFCWEVIAGEDENGAIVCHPGCSIARQARQGWPVRCTDLHLRTPLGPRKLTISTIVLRGDGEPVVLHPLRTATAAAPPPPRRRQPRLTRRQTEIPLLLAEGIHAKQIAARLTLSETTVRNHIQAILRELGAHSQLEAVAVTRELAIGTETAA